MATSFPSGLDSFTNPTAVDTLDSPPHDTQHADANDAIEALQAKVGADGSAVTTSLDYKVANLESRPVETKTVSYVLVAADVNKRIVMNNAGATTITVNDGVFAAGDTVWIHNIGAGTTTVTAGTATVDTAGSLDVGQWEGGSLYFTSASSAIFFRGGGAVSSANFTDTATGTYTDSGTNYKYLTFTSSGTLTVDRAGYADVLMIGGGGSGGGRFYAGAGGAGAYVEDTILLDALTYTITIGAGGSGNPIGTPSTSGSASVIDAGAVSYGNNGAAGDSGVGAKTKLANLRNDANEEVMPVSPTATIFAIGGGRGWGGSNESTQGGSGGAGPGSSAGGSGGGGGGAGTAGSAGVGNVAGDGGDGKSSSITGSAVTRAGGGGGESYAGNIGSGGTGGGGDGGSTTVAAQPGTANTGSGGGGASHSAFPNGGNGGSGVVIIRVAV